jgi:hypothetical protein
MYPKFPSHFSIFFFFLYFHSHVTCDINYLTSTRHMISLLLSLITYDSSSAFVNYLTSTRHMIPLLLSFWCRVCGIYVGQSCCKVKLVTLSYYYCYSDCFFKIFFLLGCIKIKVFFKLFMISTC